MAKKIITKKPAVKKAKASADKKVVLKKSVFKKPDMPKLLHIFNEIKGLMKVYEKKLNSRVNIEGKYDLWSEKEVEAFGRQYDSMYFAGIIIQSGYVGFYYMPVYGEPEMKKLFRPEFAKLLKGKSCFHIKDLDEPLKKDIKDALKMGFDRYKKLGWVN